MTDEYDPEFDEGERDYETSEDEGGRIRTLKEYNILDTPSEEEFDRLTKMAAEIFEVPVVLITLIDEDRQWFKSRVGLDKEEIDRGCSFCNEVLLEKDIVVVPDTREDSRFKNHPLVVNDPRFRFYAGAPLETEEGYVLGTFCLLDVEPGDFDDKSMRILRLFALEAFDRIELSYRKSQLEKALEAQEVLSREINHRVKNNLNMVSSLLSLQKKRASTRNPAEVLEEAENRIRAIQSIHGKLEGIPDATTVDAPEYIRDLVRDITVAGRLTEDVGVEYDLETVSLPARVAVHLGIVLNELVTNAMKYGCDDEEDRIAISLRSVDDGYRLTVEDEGPGMPANFSLEDAETLGLQLVRRTVEGTLNGDLTIDSDATGTRIDVEFSPP